MKRRCPGKATRTARVVASRLPTLITLGNQNQPTPNHPVRHIEQHDDCLVACPRGLFRAGVRLWATFGNGWSCESAGPPSAQRWGSGAPTVTTVWQLQRLPPLGLFQTEAQCHDMRKKVIPFPPRKAAHARPVTQGHFRIRIQVGTQRYALNIPCEALVVPQIGRAHV